MICRADWDVEERKVGATRTVLWIGAALAVAGGLVGAAGLVAGVLHARQAQVYGTALAALGAAVFAHGVLRKPRDERPGLDVERRL